MTKEVKRKSSKKGNSTLFASLRKLIKNKKALCILQKLGENYTQAEIAKLTPITKQGVNYWKNKFLEKMRARIYETNIKQHTYGQNAVKTPFS
jgi:DNA-directed RNA polymerase specialized sigma subunit